MKSSESELKIGELIALLEHRYPLLLLDGVRDLIPGSSCTAFKNLTYNEWFFPAHFPGESIMPGSLQIEAFTQAVAIPILASQEYCQNPKSRLLLIGIDKARYFRPVTPGDRLDICVDIKRSAMGMVSAFASGVVEGHKVSECQVTYRI